MNGSSRHDRGGSDGRFKKLVIEVQCDRVKESVKVSWTGVLGVVGKMWSLRGQVQLRSVVEGWERAVGVVDEIWRARAEKV